MSGEDKLTAQRENERDESCVTARPTLKSVLGECFIILFAIVVLPRLITKIWPDWISA